MATKRGNQGVEIISFKVRLLSEFKCVHETNIETKISVRDLVQQAERIFVGKNKQMDVLSRKQTPIYNQALFVLRREYFWWTHLNPGWRAYSPKITAMRVSYDCMSASMACTFTRT